MSLGKTIADARKKANLTQENLAAKIRRENGRSISTDYIRDLEHDRVPPPSEFLIEQLAKILNIPRYTLYYYTGRVPEEIASLSDDESLVAAVFKKIRKLLGKE